MAPLASEGRVRIVHDLHLRRKRRLQRLSCSADSHNPLRDAAFDVSVKGSCPEAS